MLRFLTVITLIFSYALLAPPAKAGGGDDSCYPVWSLYNRDIGCSDSAVIAPGNDSRGNLFLLINDGKIASDYPELEWDKSYARNFYNWRMLRGLIAPKRGGGSQDRNSYAGSRCASFPSGSTAFHAAAAANRRISGDDRKTLFEMRGFIEDLCKGKTWRGPPKNLPEILSGADNVLSALKLGSKEADQYAAYLRGASAFYGTNFAGADAVFRPLVKSKDKWIKETALYMLARVQINAAQENSFSKWGDFKGTDSTNADALGMAERRLNSYLKKYPDGRYAASARGLMRRVFWLQQDLGRLSGEYARLLQSTDGAKNADMIEEADLKLLSAQEAAGKITDPILLAVADLMRMRELQRGERKTLTYKELADQKIHFAGHEQLYQFLLANHAFYVEGNAKKILQLIPDNARQGNFNYLQFSRQALRGKALQMLKDPREEGHWRNMLAGSKSLYQRPVAQLGLATYLEHSGQLDHIFTPNSQVIDTTIRKILLQQVAGPNILRQVYRDTARPKDERDLALFVLLVKNLQRGNYADFLKDQAEVTENANTDAGFWQLAFRGPIPVGIFAGGVIDGDYDCANFTRTVQTLARSPNNAGARLCLGDFFLKNGFDYLDLKSAPRYARGLDDNPLAELGRSKNLFPGKAKTRQDIYTEIIASPRANAGEKSYALYRAIRCYATSGSNGCGGDAVPLSQRKAWFGQIKGRYPNSKWAKKLKYYW